MEEDGGEDVEQEGGGRDDNPIQSLYIITLITT